MATTPPEAIYWLHRPLAGRGHATSHLFSYSPASLTSTRSRDQWMQCISLFGATAPHRHAVDRGGVVGAGRVRQLGESSHAGTLAHVAACHGQPRPSRLGGGGDASPAKAEVRGGGHECGRSAANARPAVCRRYGGRCAARRAGRVDPALGAQAGQSDQHGVGSKAYTLCRNAKGA